MAQKERRDDRSGLRLFPAFPYEPYSIQQDFMQALYEAIDKGQIGLFESPTGTGKTLSLICSSLQWLEDRHALEAAEAQAAKSSAAEQEDADMPAWMHETSADQEQQAQQAQRLRRLKARAKATMLGSSLQSPRKQPKGAKGLAKAQARPPGSVVIAENLPEDAEFLLEAWDSDAEEATAKRKAARMEGSNSEASETDEEGDEDAAPQKRQVFFCSRTHSQLSQFVSELRRTPFAETLSVAAIAGRKALCINDAVLKLGSTTRINERCLELQKAKPAKQAATAGAANEKPAAKTSSCGCPYRKSKRTSLRHLKDAVLAVPMDVEDLGKLGRRKEACPYYAARAALLEADLVLLPYAALLLQETRESLGVNLEGAVVIVDEAHNLIDAVNAVHSAVITRKQLATAKSALDAYYGRFSSRLAPGNSKHIQSLIVLTSTLHGCLERQRGGEPRAPQIVTVNDFLFSKGLDNLNLFRLIRYVRESKAVQKVSGYAQRSTGADLPDKENEPSDGSGSGLASMHALVSLASALNNTDADGRVVVDAAGGTLKFLLLNAAAHFTKVLASAHAVVLASGTLAPVASLQQQLFPHVPHERMHHFSCGHVVPKERLLALALGRGPTGAALDLRHARRGQAAVLDEISRLLLNICQAVPQGVVVFFPSFAYADQVFGHWQATGALERLGHRKRVFREPRSAVEVESVLRQYSSIIAEQSADTSHSGTLTGALLLCVVGGKMSEGINFGDGLGRCVVVMGMPFPNPADPELCERMRFLDTTASKSAKQPQSDQHSRGASSQEAMQTAGRAYFEDLCMKAVNQCIGRVIRHRSDWAAVVLVDQRWTSAGAAGSSGTLKKLPTWIQDSLMVVGSFGEAFGRLSRFARTMQ
ncbi:hypothetical protein CVIRNUC_003145 [Coccomyxa viridis]|uniref:Helicase ATP-binding domain-containing protein n=1 Tax=Coccomyxa viridis TaxID=1274662 RepID=A0AAV1I0T7_9CHLO|nr:hypothetical protein CVIRNUC_003145 [Coccomyxa viridis]